MTLNGTETLCVMAKKWGGSQSACICIFYREYDVIFLLDISNMYGQCINFV